MASFSCLVGFFFLGVFFPLQAEILSKTNKPLWPGSCRVALAAGGMGVTRVPLSPVLPAPGAGLGQWGHGSRDRVLGSQPQRGSDPVWGCSRVSGESFEEPARC